MRDCLVIAAVLLAGAACAGQSIYQSDLTNGFGAFSLRWTGTGKLDVTLDTTKPGPSGAPSVKMLAADGTHATAGVGLKAGANRRWLIEYSGCAQTAPEGVSVNLQCWDAGGKQVDWLAVGTLPQGEKLQRFSRIIELSPQATQVNLIVLHKNAAGTSWLADLKVSEYELTPQIEAKLRRKGPVRWGVTNVLNPTDPLLRDTCAKLIVAAGVTHTRGWVDWSKIEPERGKFDFAAFDQWLDELKYYGVTPDVVCLRGTPQWASGKTAEKNMLPERKAKGVPWIGRAYWPPQDWGDWERFVSAMAARYRGRVAAWEIMNEPDLWEEGFNGTYEDYQQYLKRAYEAAKKVDPNCQVLAGAMVRDEWIGQLARDGYAKYWDAVCIHPYHGQPAGVISRARKIQFDLLAAGIEPNVVVTEVGFQSGGWQQGPAVKANEDVKAACGAEALRGLGELSDLICWYIAVERGNMYGLLRDDIDRLVPMPIFYEYGKITGKLQPDKAPVKVEVTVPEAVKRGETGQVRLVAQNASGQPVPVRFWPVGFVASLGLSSEQVRALDWSGTLAPGQAHECVVMVRPVEGANGGYPVGLAAVTDKGNALNMQTLSVN